MTEKKYDIDEGWAFAKENKFSKMVNETRFDRAKFKATKNRETAERERKPLTEAEMAEFEKASTIDALTGVLNFKTFYRKLDYELRRAKRYKRPLSLMLVQLDNLDNCKRQYGAMVEDEMVKSAVRLILGCIRDVDVCGRAEGSDIAVIFPETYSSKAMVVAERVRDKLRSESINNDLRHLRVTASIGVVSFPTHARDEHDLLQKAIQFAGHAREEGGDMVFNG
ncbi:MAG: GGDEF domain-containing protein [Candidatus Obscuribacter sp.]|nr:GGDEF domain-containing protein [Candidatus Obscuribacter sp.]